MSRWKPVMEPMAAPVMKAVRQATSYDDLRRRLQKLGPDMDSDALQEMMAEALFAALMAGRTGLKL